MSFFGRVFVVALFTASLIVWSLQAAEAIKGVVRYGIENRGPGSLRRMMIVAFLIVSYSTVMLYRGVMGWRRTLGLIVVLVVSMCVVLCLMSLARYLINLWHPNLKESKLAVVNVSQAEGDAAEGFIALFLLGIGAAWLAFLLLAPFGVLCAIGAGKCGSK